MKVLMFGWEFPPFNSGGLGTACYGLTKGLSENGVEVVMVLPRPFSGKVDFLQIESLALPGLELIACNSLLRGYGTTESYAKSWLNGGEQKMYGISLFEEVARYAEVAPLVALKHNFDIIHAHDWLTWQAGIRAAEMSAKPVILHVHATEFDRCGGEDVHPYVYKIEKECLQKADGIVTVSQQTKNKIVKKYGVEEKKIQVLHNGIYSKKPVRQSMKGFKGKKLVVFLGRLTLQKGPDYFLEVAKKTVRYRFKNTVCHRWVGRYGTKTY